MKFQVQELRPEVLAFALLMEERLREKDADRGGDSWKSATCDHLMVRTFATCMILEQQVRLHADAKIRKAVDLANYAMMIADVAGALDEAVKIINGEPQH